jgi:hypothetical protein
MDPCLFAVDINTIFVNNLYVERERSKCVLLDQHYMKFTPDIMDDMIKSIYCAPGQRPMVHLDCVLSIGVLGSQTCHVSTCAGLAPRTNRAVLHVKGKE